LKLLSEKYIDIYRTKNNVIKFLESELSTFKHAIKGDNLKIIDHLQTK